MKKKGVVKVRSMMARFLKLKSEELKNLKEDFKKDFKEMEKKKVAAQVEKQTLEEIKNIKKIREAEALFATDKDGAPLINGSNKEKRDAQVQDYIKDSIIALQKQERQTANADFELSLVYDRISLLRNLSRLLRSEIQMICDNGEEEFEERD